MLPKILSILCKNVLYMFELFGSLLLVQTDKNMAVQKLLMICSVAVVCRLADTLRDYDLFKYKLLF